MAKGRQSKKIYPGSFWIVLIAVIFIVGGILFFAKYQKKSAEPLPGTGILKPKEEIFEIKRFETEQEFRDYLEKAKNSSISLSEIGSRIGDMPLLPESQGMKSTDNIFSAENGIPSRVSETNVQVVGIDEPDLLKTDGKEIYFSTLSRSDIIPFGNTADQSEESKELQPLYQSGEVKTIKAFPPANLSVDGKIEKSGDLLLVGKMLIIIPPKRYYWSRSASKIYGYDVSNSEKPKEIWNIEMKNSVSIAGARIYNGKIYIVLRTDFRDDKSCLLQPILINGAEFSIKCTDIYHPAAVIPVDATYTAMIINPASGAIEKNISFVASSSFDSSVVYMSPNALYLSYYNPGDFVKIFNSFLTENRDLAPDWLLEKIKSLEKYEISSLAKMTEILELISRFQNSLSNDERLKMQSEIANRARDYVIRHRRKIDSTGIVKIKIGDLTIDSAGSVPGKLLNQFSLDEYKGDLRVATTVGGNFMSFGFGIATGEAGFMPNVSNDDIANDVYILDEGLKTEGSLIDLGQGERIFAVRFIEDKGYIVTFKQADPFYVLDLSDPVNPSKEGELKIPGYSSYLHPVAEDKILGIGEEGGQVKLSMFDVSDSSNPLEVSKYNLDEYWSEIFQTHHAFLQDTKHEIFFLPGGKGGYIFSYSGDNLKLKKAISGIQTKRAVFIDNFLYVIGDDRIVVLDENSWERVNELEI